MKLNLHIIWDELKTDTGELVSSEDIYFPLTGIRKVYPDQTAFSENFLYLIDAESLMRIPRMVVKTNLIVIGETAHEKIVESGSMAIIFPSKIHPEPLFQRIQEIFEKYNQWEEDVLLAIAKNASLQSIFDLGARFLRNPIALFDFSMVFMMKSGPLPENVENTIWEEVLTQGYTRMEDLPIEEQRQMAAMLVNRSEPFFYQSPGKYSSNRQIVASLKCKGKPFATFGMIDINEPFSLGQLSLVTQLKKWMELALNNDQEFLNIMEGASFFFDRLLQGFPVEKEVVRYHISKRNWILEDRYELLLFVESKSSGLFENMAEACIFRIKGLFEGALVFPYEKGILAVCRRDDRVRSDPVFKAEMIGMLDSLGLSCGISLEFLDLMNIKYAYIQAKTAIEHGQITGEKIALFESHYTDYVIKALDVSTSLKSLCHPKILQLIQEDQEKQRDFTRTLQTYLVNGRNITATANALFIHRNTLIYRLERLSSILELDLDGLDEQTLFLLYLSCLIVRSLLSKLPGVQNHPSREMGDFGPFLQVIFENGEYLKHPGFHYG